MDFTPKCHYSQHVPEQLRRFGPSQGTWTLRFEAKHSEFKANKLVNFKNVPKTLVFRWQLMMAYDMIGSDGQKSKAFFYQGDEVDIENDADFVFVNTFGHLKREFELKVMKRCNYYRNTDSAGIIVQKAKTMKLECISYKPGIFLTIETDRASYWLTFARIDNLLVLDNLKFAVVQCYKTRVFNEFLNAYKITEDVGKKNNNFGGFRKQNATTFCNTKRVQMYNNLSLYFLQQSILVCI